MRYSMYFIYVCSGKFLLAACELRDGHARVVEIMYDNIRLRYMGTDTTVNWKAIVLHVQFVNGAEISKSVLEPQLFLSATYH